MFHSPPEPSTMDPTILDPRLSTVVCTEEVEPLHVRVMGTGPKSQLVQVIFVMIGCVLK